MAEQTPHHQDLQKPQAEMEVVEAAEPETAEPVADKVEAEVEDRPAAVAHRSGKILTSHWHRP